MSMFFFTYRARMQARQGAEILREAGIPARLDRTPAQITGNGCGYGLWVTPQKAKQAAEKLRQGAPYERSYRFDQGRPQEVFL